MGFDNESILSIQSLPGEYFCPVCRTLVYPNEALQSQCTHLYCKPCLTYIVATTQACPYDGYLVTEADSKPLIELNKPLAETIGKVAVHCLYYRSGCQWQGTLSECTTHYKDCTFGSSLVVCNRCGVQIMHHQVQEHAQSCAVLQPQAQQVESSQVQASTVPTQAGTQSSSSTTAAAAATSTTTATSASTTSAAAAPAAPVSGPAAAGQVQSQGNAAGQLQAVAQAPTAEQWYQQQLQYQHYYQQCAAYNAYQQQYQQYAQYPQQVYQQNPQAYMQVPFQNAYQGQQLPVPYVVPQPQAQPQPQILPQAQAQAHAQQQPVPQPQPQPQPQSQPQPQLQTQPQPQLQPQPHPQAHPPHMLAQQVHATAPQLHTQTQPQTYPLPHAQVPAQQMGHHFQTQHTQNQQAQEPHHTAVHAPHQPVPPQLHPNPQMQLAPTHSQQFPPQQHHPQAQAHIFPQPQHQQPHMQLQPRSQSQANPQPQLQHPSAQAVTGHQSYPQPQPFQQLPPSAPQQRPMQMHPQHRGPPQQRPQQPGQIQNQFPPQQSPQMLPLLAQQSVMNQPQGPPTQQQTPQPVLQPGQPIHHHTGMHAPAQQHALPQQQIHGGVPIGQPYQHGAVPAQHAMHPPQSLPPPQHIPSHPQPQTVLYGMPTHQARAIFAKPMILNQGTQRQTFQQSPGAPMLVLAQLSHSTSQGSSIPASPAPPSTSQANLMPALNDSERNLSDKAGHMLALKLETGPVIGDGSKVSNSVSAEVKSPKHVTESETVEDEEKAIQNGKEQANRPHNEPGLGPGLPIKDEMVRDPGVKPLTVEEANESKEAGYIGSHLKAAVGNKESERQEGEANRISDRRVKEEIGSIPGGTGTVNFPLDSNQAVQRESLGENLEKSDRGFVSSRQSKGILPDMHTLQMPPGHGKRFQESQLHQMQLLGQLQAPNQMRPHGRNFPEGLIHHVQPSNVQEPFQQPLRKYPSDLFHREVSHAGLPVSGLRDSAASGSSGFPLRTFEQQTMPPHGRSQGHVPPSHNDGARFSCGPVAPPVTAGPQPGGFNTPSGMTARVPMFGPRYPVVQPRPTNPVEAEPFGTKRPEYIDGRRPEPQKVPAVNILHGPPLDGQSSMMKMDGFSEIGPTGGMHDTGRHAAIQKEFGDDLKQFPRPGHLDGEQITKFDSSRPLPPYQSDGPFPFRSGGSSAFTPYGVEERHERFGVQDNSGRKRDLMDARPDFRRPISEFGRHHLDVLPPPRSPGRVFTGLPFGKSGLASQSGNEEFEGRDLHGSGGRFKGFNFPLDAPRSTSHDSRVPQHLGAGSSILPPYQHRGDLGAPDNLQIDAHDVQPRLSGESFGYGISSIIRSGEALGSRNLPKLLRSGDSLGQGQLRMGGPTGFSGLYKHPLAGPGSFSSHLGIEELVGGVNLPVRLRSSEVGSESNYLMHGVSSGDIDSLEYSRKRKPVSMGWCRICRVDCGTVEGLDLHAQTREHQKMAMDIVLNIKRENAKKSKLTSGGGFSQEDSVKSKKANLENYKNRQ